MQNWSDWQRRLFFGLLFLVIAGLCSWQRFGQRENESVLRDTAWPSDSDFYLDMARVFTGEARAFNTNYVVRQAHHYNRPLLPFAAGHLARVALGGDVRTAFSLLNIVAIALAALVLMESLRAWKPGGSLLWMPSVLLLTGFPQLNWGYHLLTDTFGLATALIAGCYAAAVIRLTDADDPATPSRWWWHLGGLFVLSSIAFLARETVCIALVSTAWMVFVRRRRPHPVVLQCSLVLVAMILGKIPALIYSYCWQTRGVPFGLPLATLFDLRYLFDITIKSAVCFNLSWLVTAWACLRRDYRPVPDFVVGWAIGGLLYMVAGYLANRITMIGYPLRMTYALSPFVFLVVMNVFERRFSAGWRTFWALLFCVVQYGINAFGVMLVPGGKLTVVDLLQRLKNWIF